MTNFTITFAQDLIGKEVSIFPIRMRIDDTDEYCNDDGWHFYNDITLTEYSTTVDNNNEIIINTENYENDTSGYGDPSHIQIQYKENNELIRASKFIPIKNFLENNIVNFNDSNSDILFNISMNGIEPIYSDWDEETGEETISSCEPITRTISLLTELPTPIENVENLTIRGRLCTNGNRVIGMDTCLTDSYGNFSFDNLEYDDNDVFVVCDIINPGAIGNGIASNPSANF